MNLSTLCNYSSKNALKCIKTHITQNITCNSPFFGKENNYSELNLVCGEKAKRTTENKSINEWFSEH
jgi:hypothetical protein